MQPFTTTASIETTTTATFLQRSVQESGFGMEEVSMGYQRLCQATPRRLYLLVPRLGVAEKEGI